MSRLAVGDPEASPNSTIYKIPRMASQLAHVEGAPFGTRGGISVVHNFPADGEYTFRMMLHSIPTGQLYGSTVRGEQIEVSVNGQRAAVIEINPRMSESDPNGMNLQTPAIAIKAGPQRVSAAFIQRSEAPVDDLLAPVGIECSIIRKVYSPSAGKLCTTEMPPRVPNGAPSTCESCEAMRGIL